MEETRSSLQDKLETLEEQVKNTVQEATDTVSTVKDTVSTVMESVETVKDSVKESVETVRESVQETVQTVKNTFNLERQVRAHPWAMFAGATVVGFFGGRLLDRLSRSFGGSEADYTPGPAPFTGGSPAAYPGSRFTPSASPMSPGFGTTTGATAQGNGHAPAAAAPAEEESSWLSSLADNYSDELKKLKGLAIGAVGGMVRELVTAAAPPAFLDRIKDVVDGVTTKLGGERFEGSFFHQESSTSSEQGAHREERHEATMGRPLGAA